MVAAPASPAAQEAKGWGQLRRMRLSVDNYPLLTLHPHLPPPLALLTLHRGLTGVGSGAGGEDEGHRKRNLESLSPATRLPHLLPASGYLTPSVERVCGAAAKRPCLAGLALPLQMWPAGGGLGRHIASCLSWAPRPRPIGGWRVILILYPGRN